MCIFRKIHAAFRQPIEIICHAHAMRCRSMESATNSTYAKDECLASHMWNFQPDRCNLVATHTFKRPQTPDECMRYTQCVGVAIPFSRFHWKPFADDLPPKMKLFYTVLCLLYYANMWVNAAEPCAKWRCVTHRKCACLMASCAVNWIQKHAHTNDPTRIRTPRHSFPRAIRDCSSSVHRFIYFHAEYDDEICWEKCFQRTK